MARKGQSKHLKRSGAPRIWKIPRKKHTFVIHSSPGPQTKKESIALGVIIRDILKLVKNYREANSVIKTGKILVDGVVRLQPNFPVGLMDTIDIPSENISYRVLPNKGTLTPIEIPQSEKRMKICRIKGKRTVKKGIIQYGLHDGRSILAETELKVKPGDSLLIDLPSQKIVGSFGLAKGVMAMIVSGDRGGSIGIIKEIKPGTFSRTSTVNVTLQGVDTELPSSLLLPVGNEKPHLKVTAGV